MPYLGGPGGPRQLHLVATEFTEHGVRLVLILIVTSGPDKGSVYELSADQPVVLGRGPDVISLTDRKVAEQHARIWCSAGQWYVQDLGTRLGTYCNRNKLAADQPLHDGDHIQIGSSVLVVARMSHEQVERVALLGGSAETDRLMMLDGQVRPRGRGRLGVAVLAVAAVAVLSLNVYLYLNVSRQNEQLRELLAVRQVEPMPVSAATVIEPAAVDLVVAAPIHEKPFIEPAPMLEQPEPVRAQQDTAPAVAVANTPASVAPAEVTRRINVEQFADALAQMVSRAASTWRDLQVQVRDAQHEQPAEAESVAVASVDIEDEQTTTISPADVIFETSLSETERAYKLAWETGKPAVIGAGRINPETGEVSEGRLLDPAAARAAGVTTWRGWYFMDDLAERTRLKEEASRLKQSTMSEDGLIRLPGSPAPATATP